MKTDFMRAINQLCAERNLPEAVVLEVVEQALLSAYKRDFGLAGNVRAKIDPATGEVKILAEKSVVEKVEDPQNEMSLEEAKRIVDKAALGEMILVETTPPNFGRIAAQTAKQVILQRIREVERDELYKTFANQEGEIVNGVVQSVDSQAVILSLGRAEAILPKSEQIPTERYRPRQRLRVYVLEVRKTSHGPEIIVSRSHKAMLRRLLELEVPEIYNGVVEIRAIAREPGFRSKVAVVALQPGIDPVGACVGMRGMRIQSIVNELGGERIDVVEWSSDSRVFIANALSPARPTGVEAIESEEAGKTAIVVVPDKQLSLAIGREGQNARLAAKLTGWRIDILSPEEAEERVKAIAAQESVRIAEALKKGKVKAGEVGDRTPIGALGLSSRILGALEGAGLKLVGDLLGKLREGENGLLAISGVGPKSAAEIVSRLTAAQVYPFPKPVEEVVPEVAPPAEVEVEKVEVAAAEEAIAQAAVQEEVALPELLEVEVAVPEVRKEEPQPEAFGLKKGKRKKGFVQEEKPKETKKRLKTGRRREDWMEELELWESGEYDLKKE